MGIKLLKVIRFLCILPFIVSMVLVIYHLVMQGGYVFYNVKPTVEMVLNCVWGSIKDIFYGVADYVTVSGAWGLLFGYIALDFIIPALSRAIRKREIKEDRK